MRTYIYICAPPEGGIYEITVKADSLSSAYEAARRAVLPAHRMYLSPKR